MDLLDTPDVVEFSFEHELMEDPWEDPELGEHRLDHNVEDAELDTSIAVLT